METIFGFPDTSISGADCERKSVTNEVAVDQRNDNADPMDEGDCDLSIQKIQGSVR